MKNLWLKQYIKDVNDRFCQEEIKGEQEVIYFPFDEITIKFGQDEI